MARLKGAIKKRHKARVKKINKIVRAGIKDLKKLRARRKK